MSGRPMRRPWPNDLVMSDTGLMLGRPKRGAPLVASKPQDVSQVAPTDYDYSAQSPLIEKVMPLDDLSGGFGLRMQQAWQDRRSYYALGVDTSVPGITIKGPEVNTVTPSTLDATTGVTRFFEIDSKIYALNGRYCHKRTSDLDWDTGRKDFGSGKSAVDSVVFHTNAGAGANYAYIAMGDSEPIWKYDGTTYTQHAEATKIYSRAWAMVGRELYRALNVNYSSKVDTNADPFVEANWTSAKSFYVGDHKSGITRMAVNATGTLVIFKTDGVYSLDSSGNDIRYYPFMDFAPSAANGEPVGAWLNDLYVTYGEGCFRIAPDFTITEIGPEKLTGNNSEVRGHVTAMQGHDQFCMYAALYNPDTGNSYILKFVSGDIWHGSITAAFSSKKITCLYLSTIGADSGHTRMYIGFSDGTVGWFALPCTYNPAACSSYKFTTADAYLYYPVLTFLFGSDQKSIKAATVTNLNHSGSNYVQLEYRTDPSGSYTAMGTNFTTITRQKAEFPNNTAGTLLDVRTIFKNTANTASPQMTGLGLHHAVRPALLQVYDFSVLAEDGLIKRDGTPMRIGADQIRTVVKTAAETAGSVTVILPDEQTKQVSVIAYDERQAWDDRFRQWRSAIGIRAAEFKTLTPYGTYGRLEPYLYSGLQSFTYGELEGM